MVLFIDIFKDSIGKIIKNIFLYNRNNTYILQFYILK